MESVLHASCDLLEAAQEAGPPSRGDESGAEAEEWEGGREAERKRNGVVRGRGRGNGGSESTA